MEATDIKVGFAQLLSPAAAVTAAIANCGGVAVGAWGSHLMIGRGHICLLWRKQRALFRYMKLDVRLIWLDRSGQSDKYYNRSL